MLNDAPDSAIGGSYNVKSSKGGRRVFAGGCTRRPDMPLNGKIKCSLDRYTYIENLRIIIYKFLYYNLLDRLIDKFFLVDIRNIKFFRYKDNMMLRDI